jgi:UDP-glucose 4-epimerase
MNVLLTGHGTLGLPLAQRLAAMGHRVRVLSRSMWTDVPWEIVHGRLDDRDAVRSAVDGCEAVIHNGARQADRHDLAAHPEFIATNVVGSANVFHAAASAGVRHVVHLSSDVVLGTGTPAADLEAAGRARCVRDSDPCDPHNIYDSTKVLAEELARYYRQRHGLSVTVLRPGWFPVPGHLADHEFVYRLLGHCLWVGDVISAVLAAVARPVQGEFLIHAAVPFTEDDAPDLLRAPARVLHKYWPDEMDWWESQRLPIAPVRWWADIAPARERLGFAPELNFPQAVARLRAGKGPCPTAGVQLAAETG